MGTASEPKGNNPTGVDGDALQASDAVRQVCFTPRLTGPLLAN
jgi:hypothetical protein